MQKNLISFSLFVLIVLSLSCSKSESLDGKINEDNPGQFLEVSIANPEYIICVIGDTGKSPTQITLSSQRLQAANCDEIRHVGDIIYPKGIKDIDDPSLSEHFLTPFNNYLSSNIPIYLSLGNHDYYSNPAAWLDLAKVNSNVVLPSSYFATFYNFGLCSITLDSNAHINDQLIWLSDFFDDGESDRCKKIFFFMHHPLYSSGPHGNARGPIAKLYKGFVTGRADATFSGHDHLVSYEIEKNGTKFFISGGFSQLRSEDLNGQAIYANNTDYTFIKITINTSDLSSMKTEFLTLDGSLTKLFGVDI